MSDLWQDKLPLMADMLNQHHSWAVFCHENPDGDTLGCGLALYSLGQRLGKNVRLLGKDPLPGRYAFLPGAESYEQVALVPDSVQNSLIICVDASTLLRVVPGLRQNLSVCPASVSIDHHGDNQLFCAVNIVAPKASATAEMVAKLFAVGGWGLTQAEAVCLYTALVTDNGNFRFNSTSPHSHLCAARLLEAGVDPSFVDDCVNENLSGPVLKLWGLAMSRTETFAAGIGAVFWLAREDFDAALADASSVDGLVNMLLRIRGVKIAIFICELFGANKASIRTRKPYSARELAAVFGGGGHDQAAGCRVEGTFAEARKKIITEAEKYAANRNTADQ